MHLQRNSCQTSSYVLVVSVSACKVSACFLWVLISIDSQFMEYHMAGIYNELSCVFG
eukprot:c26139_g1_i1 orf=168-338(+)